jgi:hypothetical protein
MSVTMSWREHGVVTPYDLRCRTLSAPGKRSQQDTLTRSYTAALGMAVEPPKKRACTYDWHWPLPFRWGRKSRRDNLCSPTS